MGKTLTKWTKSAKVGEKFTKWAKIDQRWPKIGSNIFYIEFSYKKPDKNFLIKIDFPNFGT